MPGAAIALIAAVILYELLASKPAAANRGVSAARATTATRQVATGAAATTSAISGIGKLLGGLLSGFSGGGSGSTQTGFNQPSNQAVNTVMSPGGGTVTYNTDGTVTIDGQIYDNSGNLITDGPFLPPDFSNQVQQSAPGDGTFTGQNLGVDPLTGELIDPSIDANVNQDAALAQDVNNFGDPFSDPSLGF
jgi:hypothetical protein